MNTVVEPLTNIHVHAPPPQKKIIKGEGGYAMLIFNVHCPFVIFPSHFKKDYVVSQTYQILNRIYLTILCHKKLLKHLN